MSKLNFILNGQPVQAEAGSTILEAARYNGVEVPTLCHDPRLKPTAACRICLVRVEGARGPLPACATPLAGGMVVNTETEELINTRRMALELMLSDHYGDCVAPCKLACPAGIDIQGYIGLIANGMYAEALKLIKESNPLPSICGRVCPRFCEQQCRRNLVDGPVAINALKRFAADYAANNGIACQPRIKPPTGKKVAVVGGGPAGLSAAYFLARQGHSVSIFDANPELGGMMRYGIPAYRLPREVLDREIADITALCKEVRCNTALGKDFNLESLKKDGFDAVFVAVGAQADQKMHVEGETLNGVYSGIGFLRDVALGKKVALGQKVAVIGGGNTAIDAAQTAVRMGSSDVTIVYRRSRDEMPASPDEIKQAEEKGVKICFLAAPLKLATCNGRVDKIECVRMALGEPDSSGRRKPEPLSGSEFIMEVDNVISAIGQTLKKEGPDIADKIKLNGRGYLDIDRDTMQTSQEGVFAGGDCASGPATVVEAVAAGHRAATSIDRFLCGQPVQPVKKPYNCSKGSLQEMDAAEYADVPRIPRVEMPTRDPKQNDGFAEFELGFTENMALIETGRCLACGCQKAFDCTLRDLATEYGVDSKKYNGLKHKREIDEHEHPNIIRDTNKCILCGRCVRICSEVAGVGALGFVNRGFETVVEPALGLPLQQTNCNSCGLCLSTCPTGAILPKVNLPKPGPWETVKQPTVCPGCGVGCNIELNLIGSRVVKVTSQPDAAVNHGNLCNRGVFGPYALNGMKRLTKPLVVRNGNLVEASWEEALKIAAAGLLDIKNKKGGEKLAVLLAPQLTNEESYLAQKLARTALGTNNLGCPAVPFLNEGLLRHLGKDGSTCTFDDLRASDLAIIYNCDIEERYPVAALAVREAVAAGSRLVTLGSHQAAIDFMANINLKVNRRTSLDVLNAMLSYIVTYNLVDRDFVSSNVKGYADFASEIRQHSLSKIYDIPWVNPSKLIEAVQLFVRARNPVIIIDGDHITPQEAAAISQCALITGNTGRKGAGIMVLRSGCNAQGMLDMGIVHNYLPGQAPLADPSRRRFFETEWSENIPENHGSNVVGIIEGIEKEEIQGVLIIGNGALAENANTVLGSQVFSVLIGEVLPEKPPYPDVILPAATFAESDGTYTNCEGRIQKLHPAFTPPAGWQNRHILAALSGALGCKMNYASTTAVTGEIGRLVAQYRNINCSQRQMLQQKRFPVGGCK
ncbi:MAG: NAD(P)-binding protein [Dehalococcoidia bacterium]|nr:NAD(P)-binding protein [Dehalococcoidia bacterium]